MGEGRDASRKQRGMRTQNLLADRWASTRLYPHATSAAAGRPGKDILHTPGLYVEVKAKGRLTLLETLKKAERGADANETVVVVWRHNGQGEVDPGQWTATVRLETFEQLWAAARSLQPAYEG